MADNYRYSYAECCASCRNAGLEVSDIFDIPHSHVNTRCKVRDVLVQDLYVCDKYADQGPLYFGNVKV